MGESLGKWQGEGQGIFLLYQSLQLGYDLKERNAKRHACWEKIC
jgi:hypothetical protein